MNIQREYEDRYEAERYAEQQERDWCAMMDAHDARRDREQQAKQ